MTRDIAPFGVRMPAELKEQLQAMATDNKRSVNAEVVAAIEQAVVLHNRNKQKNTRVKIDSDMTDSLNNEEILKRIAELLSKHGI